MSAQTVTWWIWGALAFTCGVAFAVAWRRAGRELQAAMQPGRPGELAARQAAGPRLGHQNLAWPPHGQRPVTGPPPSVRHLGPPPAARSLADTDWALWAEEMNHR